MRRTVVSVRRSAFAGVAAVIAVFVTSCGDSNLLLNNVTERRGNITVSFVNSTRFRAAFSFGTWDELDRDPPGGISLNQLRVNGETTSASTDLPCRRNLAVGTEKLVRRVVDTQTGADDPNFDFDAFTAGVNFSSAPEDSDAAALPTAGTSRGRELLLGIDYFCRDEIIFTFVEDPDAAGGFRIDATVIPSEAR